MNMLEQFELAEAASDVVTNQRHLIESTAPSFASLCATCATSRLTSVILQHRPKTAKLPFLLPIQSILGSNPSSYVQGY